MNFKELQTNLLTTSCIHRRLQLCSPRWTPRVRCFLVSCSWKL
ncbi:hypothetical protein RchiOBHm_Chr1g0317101 [Rosa chinensis]|uniref:Uncharacterized protein n=1 Tax=Rosa chinensis TaxID=74649 RepID=A0A2P6S7V9_ROSCH|nr:hypothetical protein RchiOBHm_Chr1g0317101 [Rosa chinensis]